MVLGHEPAGTVLRTGPGVTGFAAGDRAALEPAIYCYHCEFCRAGRHNICRHLRFLSTPGDPGFFREVVNLPAGNLLAIPASLALDHATLVEPLAVAIHSLHFAGMALGGTVAVLGAGPIGLCTIACLKTAGAARIFAVEPVGSRRALALHMGADAALDPAAGDVVKEILAGTAGRGVDVAIDCAARQETTNQAIHAVCNGGRVVVIGIHCEVRVSFEVSPLRRKEVAIFNVRRSNHESEAALEMLTAQIGRFAPMVTHHRPLDQIAEAFRIAGTYSDGVGKMIVTPA